ncbi:hypothetical protein KZX45_12965 [Georgenia sp. EYE_87]|uniref:hypothetical protein n=1 Tax=Georgenia sp. EYE_87 TaxID=2853448 RepID=UPI0020058261|nr:hypothetical protein [Georgenia sp. EYE_87]MCK6211456.1 hypothetical protein [Georgenia sp. EYE_87]
MTRSVRALVVLGAVAFLVPGVWSFGWPRSFHETVAQFDPFNLHLFHDLGAFQIGIGVALLAALAWRDAVAVALAGATAGAVVHAASHVIDRDLGGRASDPYLLSLLALALAAGLVLRLRRVARGSTEGPVREHRRTALDPSPRTPDGRSA